MTILEKLERLHKEATPMKQWMERGCPLTMPDRALIVAMRNALPKLLRVVRAAEEAQRHLHERKGSIVAVLNAALSDLNETG